MASKKKKVTRVNTNQKEGKWTKPLWYILILVGINILIFARTSSYDFVNIDDGVLIHENPLVTNSNIPYSEVFQSKIFGPHYKPLTFLTWKSQYNLFGSNASHFHTVNWILHILNTIILFLIGRKLFSKLYDDKKKLLFSACLLALLFAINPLRLESVAWATERKDVLFSLFFLSSWYVYIKYIEQRKYLFLILGGILYLLSGLSKSMGLTLLAVIFLTDLWYNEKINVKSALNKAPYFIAFGILIYFYGILDFGGESISQGAEVAQNVKKANNISALPVVNDLPFILQLLVSASLRFVLWIVHSFIPINTSIEYSHEAIFGFFSYALYLFPFIVATIYLFAWKIRKTTTIVLGGLLFFGLTISPILTYTSSGIAAFLSDRYTYIPSIGLFFILVYYLNKLEENKAKQFLATGGILGFFLITSLINVSNWENSESLFKRVLDINPKSSLGYQNLGLHYKNNGLANKAIEVYSRGITNGPSSELYVNRGKAYFDQGNIDFALNDFNKSISIDANNADALGNRGAVFGAKGDWSNCFADLNKAIDIDSDNLTALSNRGFAYFDRQQYDKAIIDYIKYLEIEPNDSEIHNSLGICYLRTEDFTNAIKHLNSAIRYDSRRATLYMNRSYAHNGNGNQAAALKDALQAQKLGFKVNQNYLNRLK